MSRYHARHRRETQSLGVARRTATAAGLGILATGAVAGTSAAALACPSGNGANTAASVHHAVAHGRASGHPHRHATKETATSSRRSESTVGGSPRRGASAGATRGASSSNPDGASNGGVDKPWGAAAANDDVDGNNGSGNDADCEDDNNGDGTPGHCGATFHAHGHVVSHAHRTEAAGAATTTRVVAGVGTVRTTVRAVTDRAVLVTVTMPGVRALTTTVTAPAPGATGTTAGTAGGAGTVSPQVLGEQISRGLSNAATAARPSASTGASTGATAVSPSSTQLPFTGSEDLPIVALTGAAGVVTGAGVVRAARRRKQSGRGSAA